MPFNIQGTGGIKIIIKKERKKKITIENISGHRILK